MCCFKIEKIVSYVGGGALHAGSCDSRNRSLLRPVWPSLCREPENGCARCPQQQACLIMRATPLCARTLGIVFFKKCRVFMLFFFLVFSKETGFFIVFIVCCCLRARYSHRALCFVPVTIYHTSRNVTWVLLASHQSNVLLNSRHRFVQEEKQKQRRHELRRGQDTRGSNANLTLKEAATITGEEAPLAPRTTKTPFPTIVSLMS